MKEYKKKILEDIQKSGFPAEIDVSSVLEQEKWMVYNGQLFFDGEESKEREIDIHAVNVDKSLSKIVPPKIQHGDVCRSISHLIIEVKKCEKPIVFFQYGKIQTEFFPSKMFKSDRERFHRLSIDAPWSDYAYGDEFYEKKECMKRYGLESHRYRTNLLHKTFYTAFAPAQSSQIYEAVKKTHKALVYQRSKYCTGPCSLHIFTPVIVVDGDLWSAALDKAGKVRLRQVEHLLLEGSQLVPGGDGVRYEEGQIYDVVSRKGFSKFLNTIGKDDLSIYVAWSNFIQKNTKVSKFSGSHHGK